MPRCKHCKEVFKPKYFNQKYHLDRNECIKAMVEENNAKKAEKDAKEWSKEKKERKEALMTYSEWLELLQKTFNTYIRIRDGKKCISCETEKQDIQYAAGHYFSVGGFPNVRFDEDNVHSQCNSYCNNHLSANIVNYRPRLIKKIGIERFEALEYRARNTTLKLSIPEIKKKIKEYKNKIKELKNGN